MSKSLGNTADPFGAIATYGVDQIRYFMANVGGNFRNDVGESLSFIVPDFTLRHTDWSETQVKKETAELKNVLGNLLLRITSPKIRAIIDKSEKQEIQDSRYDKLQELTRALPDAVARHLDSMEVGFALRQIFEVLRLVSGNDYPCTYITHQYKRPIRT